MATVIPRCRTLLQASTRRASSSSRPRSAQPHTLQLRSISRTSIFRAKDDDESYGQRDPTDPVTKDTGAPFDTSNYNPQIKSKQLPEGWGGEKSLDEEIREARTGPQPRDPSQRSPENEYEEESIADIEGDLEPSARDFHLLDMRNDVLGAAFQRINEQKGLDEDGDDEDDLDDEMEDPRDNDVAKGFFALDEEKNDPGEDPEFENDDITSLAHGELEQHRELREFYRLIVWDMPLLYNQIVPFEAPTAATPLRFRYTSYMGDTHPAARKVVCTFSPSEMPSLSEKQKHKLLLLLGPRYNSITDSAKLSCELHPTVAQNKRHLGELVERLLMEARKVEGKEAFEDIPLDERHMAKRFRKEKRKNVSASFPEGWKLSKERQEQLSNERKARAEREAADRQKGRLIDGAELVLQRLMPNRTAAPLLGVGSPQDAGNGMGNPDKERQTLPVGVSPQQHQQQQQRPRTVLR